MGSVMAVGAESSAGLEYICLVFVCFLCFVFLKRLNVSTKVPGVTTVTCVSERNTLIGPPGAEVVVVGVGRSTNQSQFPSRVGCPVSLLS